MGPGNNLNEKLLSGPAPGSAPVGDDHGLTARVESFSRSGSEFATMVGQLGTKRDTRTLRASLAESRDQLSREAKALTAAFKDWSPVDRPARLRRDRLLRQLEKAVGGYRGAAQLSLRKERVLVERMSGAEGHDTPSKLYSTSSGTGSSIYASSSGTLPVVVPGKEGRFAQAADDGDLYNTALGDAVSQQRLQAQRVESNARLEAEIAAERREEIRLLEGDIVDLAQVFQECAQLVKDQGEELDTIEAHVGQAVERTERGVLQLEEAAKYQKKSRKKMCILMMLILGIGIATALPFILKHKRAAKDA